MAKYRKDKKTLAVSLIVISLLFAVLMLITPTRDMLIGLFGWAVCVYIPMVFAIGVLLYLGKQISLAKKQAVIYSALFVLFVATLHILFAKNLIAGNESYILAPIQGHNTVGGTLMSLLTIPFKLIFFNHYGFLLAFFFILTSTVCFLAIYPYLNQPPNKAKKDKRSKSKLFVSSVEDEEQPANVTPKEPVDTFKPDNKLFNLFRGPKSVEEVFNTPKEPEKKPFSSLDRLGSYESYPRDEGKRAVESPQNDAFSRKFGTRTPEEEYEIRYKNMPIYEPYDQRVTEQTSQSAYNPSTPVNAYTPQPINTYPMVKDESYQKPVEVHDYSEPTIEKPYFKPELHERDRKKDIEYINTPLTGEEYVGLFNMEPRVGRPPQRVQQLPLDKPQDNGYDAKSSQYQPAYQQTEPAKVQHDMPPKPVQTDLFRSSNQGDAVQIKDSRYIIPPIELLKSYPKNNPEFPHDYQIIKEIIEQNLRNANIVAEVITARQGPSFTRYELRLENNQNISKIAGMSNIFEMCLERENVTIHAPIKGKNAVGIDIPNRERDIVGLRSVISSAEFMNPKGGVQLAFGKDLEGKPIVADLSKLYHLLVAGATGTGKSVFINSLILSILYKHPPEDVRLLLIDPKKVELSVYQNLPNLLINETVKELDQTLALLKWLTKEMDDRYSFLESKGCNELDMYNNSVRDKNTEPKIPRIILIIDEMADLMIKSKGQVESYIIRIAQLGRACGIHLILATQRPTVNVITGLISSNIMPRVAFAVKKVIDSRIILDEGGAEKLLGKGDLIYSNLTTTRMQGAYVDMNEIRSVCNFIKTHNKANFDEKLNYLLKNLPTEAEKQEEKTVSAEGERDSNFEMLLRRILKTFIIEKKASISSAQTRNGIGYPKAKKIVDILADRGYISSEDNGKPREVLITLEQFHEEFGEDE